MIAYAIQPCVVFPSHFKKDPNYISDTENSEKLSQKSDFKSANLIKNHISPDKFIKDNIDERFSKYVGDRHTEL
jgi:hypothetical protein